MFVLCIDFCICCLWCVLRINFERYLVVCIFVGIAYNALVTVRPTFPPFPYPPRMYLRYTRPEVIAFPSRYCFCSKVVFLLDKYWLSNDFFFRHPIRSDDQLPMQHLLHVARPHESRVISSILPPVQFLMLPIYDVLGVPRRRLPNANDLPIFIDNASSIRTLTHKMQTRCKMN